MLFFLLPDLFSSWCFYLQYPHLLRFPYSPGVECSCPAWLFPSQEEGAIPRLTSVLHILRAPWAEHGRKDPLPPPPPPEQSRLHAKAGRGATVSFDGKKMLWGKKWKHPSVAFPEMKDTYLPDTGVPGVKEKHTGPLWKVGRQLCVATAGGEEDPRLNWAQLHLRQGR